MKFHYEDIHIPGAYQLPENHMLLRRENSGYTNVHVVGAYHPPPNAYLKGTLRGQETTIAGPMSRKEAEELERQYNPEKYKHETCNTTCEVCFPPSCKLYLERNLMACCMSADCKICRNRNWYDTSKPMPLNRGYWRSDVKWN